MRALEMLLDWRCLRNRGETLAIHHKPVVSALSKNTRLGLCRKLFSPRQAAGLCFLRFPDFAQVVKLKKDSLALHFQEGEEKEVSPQTNARSFKNASSLKRRIHASKFLSPENKHGLKESLGPATHF